MRPQANSTSRGADVLPLAKLQTALESCREEAYWQPSYAGGILCVPLLDEGDAGGFQVVAHKQRRAYQGLVVAVNGTKRVQVGDLISWDQGRGEEITTLLGEKFFHLTENNASAVDDEFRPKEPTLQASGLWVA